ncbi:hypothetical protein BOTBODRAFT_126829 [Botryobasidium botryosum FD-172 SS1]|uniref:RhoGAP-domain-containing protein n=1 Tax=Botryobasidium botryosum (strain FD-172 SS1) TaxID=930990 RepID=A0A067N5D6_BOTB1|nr:hypothetical protein BOTBODRAFT_126829 [Botryobasidium botryosum FD-172 SS1]
MNRSRPTSPNSGAARNPNPDQDDLLQSRRALSPRPSPPVASDSRNPTHLPRRQSSTRLPYRAPDGYPQQQQQQQQQQQPQQYPPVFEDGPFSAPPTSTPSSLPARSVPMPTRASTLNSPSPHDHEHQSYFPAKTSYSAHGHSERDYHPDPLPAPTPSYLNPNQSPSSRSNTPSNSHSDDTHLSAGSTQTSTTSANAAPSAQGSASLCHTCQQPMTGQFVRALGAVYHLECFRCQDCNVIVASKFFPIEGLDGRQVPLCERDYFKRLDLICAKCGQALRGSYITACNKKFHVEHFTCSVCPHHFSAQDSYYEHQGDVYCHYHYSTRFATKCVGCNSAILKQFVEINRNMRDECWHPECYMINKFWNVKVVSRLSTLIEPAELDNSTPWAEEESRETPLSIKEKQTKMESQVYRIWTHLSAFEESSAACISDMLRHVSNGHYLEAIRMAEKFILHVEVLFAAIDDLEAQFAAAGVKGMSHIREARMLCRKTVDLFQLLSHTGGETGTSRRMGMTQELLALVTGLAHYLKILIRIALTGALKLEREQKNTEALPDFLDKLHHLAVEGGSPTARRLTTAGSRAREVQVGGRVPPFSGTEGVAYGYKSLSPELAGESPFSPAGLRNTNPLPTPSDLCLACGQTVEEDCVRLNTYQRWHSQCVKCSTCGKSAAPPSKDKEKEKERMALALAQAQAEENREGGEMPEVKLSSHRRPPANVNDFVFERVGSHGDAPRAIYCKAHGHVGCQQGFSPVSRLEQYAYLLNVALRRLFFMLKKKGVMVMPAFPATAAPGTPNAQGGQDAYSDMRVRAAHLDRKLSATARVPRRSTIVESPTGKIAHAMDPSRYPGPQESTASFKTQSSTSTAVAPPVPTLRSPKPIRSTTRSKPSSPPDRTTAHQVAVIRPDFARNNTQVCIIDDNVPEEGAGARDGAQRGGPRSPTRQSFADDGLTLADIPRLLESEQAREQHRPLPRQDGKPLIAELNPLELMIVKHFAVLQLYRSPLREHFDLDEVLGSLEVKKNTFWDKFFKGGNDRKNVRKKGVFGVPLEQLVEREGADSLLGASNAPLCVPSFIDDLISAMRQMDMSVEGIFRKNGNIRRLKDLTDAIDRDPSTVDLTTDNPVQLAALLKKFLRELPDPLLTFKLHRLFVAVLALPNEEDRHRYLHLVTIILPRCHRDTMEVLFVFLKWVASFSHVDEATGSKMDLQNLSTVICPNILYSRGRDAVRDESFNAIRVVTQLLEYQDEYYTVPAEFLPMLRDQEHFASYVDLPSKEILKKCDTYLRMKQSGPPIASAPPANNSSNSSASRADGADVRLVHNQRSDPMMGRGRPPPPSHTESSRGPYPPPSSSNPRSRNGHGARSQERSSPPDPAYENTGGGRHTPRPSPHPELPYPTPPSQQQQQQHWQNGQDAAPLSPRLQQAREAPWAAPRPSSYPRQSGEHFPPTNGRHSPAVHVQQRS